MVRGATVYAVLLVIFRLSRRRTLAQMTPFDFVLLLIVAETTRQLGPSNLSRDNFVIFMRGIRLDALGVQ